MIPRRAGKSDMCGCAHVLLTHQLSFHPSDKSADTLRGLLVGEGWGVGGGVQRQISGLLFKVSHTVEKVLIQLQMLEGAAAQIKRPEEGFEARNYLHQ